MSSVKSSEIVYSTTTTTWRWMWPDILMRIIPMTLVPLIYVYVLHLPPSFLGLTLSHVSLHILLGFIVGIIMSAFAATYRRYIIGTGFRRPTPADQLFQSFFYLFINAPAEELFFRGFMLAIVAQWTGSLFLGWLVSSAAYTLYHRLGKWNWRSVIGVGIAGLVFSLVYLLLPGPHSLVAVIIVHGLTTSGFLSWGDEILYQGWKSKRAEIREDLQ